MSIAGDGAAEPYQLPVAYRDEGRPGLSGGAGRAGAGIRTASGTRRGRRAGSQPCRLHRRLLGAGDRRAARFWIAPAERSGGGALDFLQIVISSLLAAASARSRGIFRKYISDPSA